MGFKSLSKSDKTFKTLKQHLLNKEGFTSKYCILDSSKSTPYYFTCPNCNQSSCNIDHTDANSFDPKKIKINLESIKSLGGAGTISKLICCENCLTNYFVGIGYIEPNYGRDVLLMHTIIELEELTDTINPKESYNKWHREKFPEQYIWENFKYPNFGISENQLVCTIQLTILNCQNCQLLIDNQVLSSEHQNTIDFILKNQSSFTDNILKMTFEYYKYLWSDFLYEFEDEIKYPNPNSIDYNEIRKMITPKAVHLANKISEGYFGITFTNTFELEHGLGIRFRDYKIEEVGGEDIGFDLMPEK